MRQSAVVCYSGNANSLTKNFHYWDKIVKKRVVRYSFFVLRDFSIFFHVYKLLDSQHSLLLIVKPRLSRIFQVLKSSTQVYEYHALLYKTRHAPYALKLRMMNLAAWSTRPYWLYLPYKNHTHTDHIDTFTESSH